jgi:hypothetical protein
MKNVLARIKCSIHYSGGSRRFRVFDFDPGFRGARPIGRNRACARCADNACTAGFAGNTVPTRTAAGNRATNTSTSAGSAVGGSGGSSARPQRPNPPGQTSGRDRGLRRKRLVLAAERTALGRPPSPIQLVQRTVMTIRIRPRRAPQAIAATFRPAQTPTDRSVQPTAPISLSMVSDGSAENLRGSRWRVSRGNSGSAAGGAGTRTCVTSTVRRWDAGSMTTTTPN